MNEYYKKKSEDMFSIVAVGILGCTLIIGTIIIILFSFIFYSYWKPIFSLIIIYLILISYFSVKKNVQLKLAIPLLLVPLIYFKYSFFLSQILKVEEVTFLSYSNNLPLGISFITFTAIALLVDIKKKVFQESYKF